MAGASGGPGRYSHDAGMRTNELTRSAARGGQLLTALQGGSSWP